MPKRYSNEKLEYFTSCPMEQRVPTKLPGEKPDAGGECNGTNANSKEGQILVEWNNNDVLVMEGFDRSIVEKARQVLFYNMTLPSDAKGKNTK